MKYSLGSFCRENNISKAGSEQVVAVSVNDGRIFYDGSIVQEERWKISLLYNSDKLLKSHEKL